MSIYRREYGLDRPGGCVVGGDDWAEALKWRVLRRGLTREIIALLRWRLADMLVDKGCRAIAEQGNANQSYV